MLVPAVDDDVIIVIILKAVGEPLKDMRQESNG